MLKLEMSNDHWRVHVDPIIATLCMISFNDINRLESILNPGKFEESRGDYGPNNSDRMDERAPMNLRPAYALRRRCGAVGYQR